MDVLCTQTCTRGLLTAQHTYVAQFHFCHVVLGHVIMVMTDWLLQVRQHTEHKRTFMFLEQVILKYSAAANCINIKDIHEVG